MLVGRFEQRIPLRHMIALRRRAKPILVRLYVIASEYDFSFFSAILLASCFIAFNSNTIRSLYLVRNQIPLKVIDAFKSFVLSRLSFSAVFLHTLTAKNSNRINRQIDWGIKVSYCGQKLDQSIDLLIKESSLPAELFVSKISPIKIKTDIRHSETTEIFKKFTSSHSAVHNKRRIKISYKRARKRRAVTTI